MEVAQEMNSAILFCPPWALLGHQDREHSWEEAAGNTAAPSWILICFLLSVSPTR